MNLPDIITTQSVHRTKQQLKNTERGEREYYKTLPCESPRHEINKNQKLKNNNKIKEGRTTTLISHLLSCVFSHNAVRPYYNANEAI